MNARINQDLVQKMLLSTQDQNAWKHVENMISELAKLISTSAETVGQHLNSVNSILVMLYV